MGGSTLTTMGERVREQRQQGTCAYLFLVMECDRPTAAPARFCLDKINTVAVGRGEERGARIEEESSLRKLTVAVADKRMSSSHMRLEKALGKWLLIDGGSKNGTYVRGERTERAELADGDLIELGHTMFVFRQALPKVGPAIVDATELHPSSPVLATLVPSLQADFDRLVAIAESNVPVLVGGETGTGKELIARAIHRASGRRGAMIAVNCGAMPDTLVESELFGHVKGAFSGATSDRAGHFRSADKGTLLLDEIGDLPLPTQPALLRVLQESEVVPVGASKPVSIDARVVAATHRDLDSLVEADEFRADLLNRLAGFRFQLLPLRERREDLGLIVRALLERLVGDAAGDVSISIPAARILMSASWPGNVRELERSLQAACALAGNGRIDVDHLPETVRSPATAPELSSLSETDTALREAVVEALRDQGGNVSAAARQLGKARQQLQRWIRRFELDPTSFRR